MIDLLKEMREECLPKLYADEIDIKDYLDLSMQDILDTDFEEKEKEY